MPTIDARHLDKKQFYRDHLFASKPLLVKNLCKTWPAYNLWRSEKYLRKRAGSQVINCETTPRDVNEYVYYKKEYGWGKK